MLLHALATQFGLDVAPARLERIGKGYHTFVTQRFDRRDGRRVFFTSAMALLSRTDSDEASYLDLAVVIGKQAAKGAVEDDLRELFRRVLFNVATGNRDDHLRNHGFVRQAGGWRLAPAFDMNPAPEKTAHVLAIDEASAEPDLDTVISTAAFYRVSAAQAQADLARLRRVLAGWKTKARALGLSAEDGLDLEACIQA